MNPTAPLTAEELKPCPMCGSDIAPYLWADNPDKPLDVTVVCGVNRRGCGAAGPYERTKAAAIAAWNRRATVAPARGDGVVAELDWLAENRNCELSHGSWDDEPQVWQVHRVNGGRSDREWTLIGSGDTPAEAIRAAMLAAAPTAASGEEEG